MEEAKVDGAIFAALKERGYVFDDPSSEEQLLQYITGRHSKQEKRQTFIICPTLSCNLRCGYCFEGDLTRNNHSNMNIGDIDCVFTAIDKIMGDHEDYKYSISLFGGEPLLPNTKKMVEALLKGAQSRSLPVGLNTNGTRIGHFFDLLKSYEDTIKSAHITIDGPKDVHDRRRISAGGKGTFDKICSGIDLLLQTEIKVELRINVDLQNIDFLPDLFDQIVEKGWVNKPYFSCHLSLVQDHAQKGIYKYLLTEDQLVEKVLWMFKSNPYLKSNIQLNMFKTLKHIMSVIDGGKLRQPMFHYCEANNLESLTFAPDGYIYACTECMGTRELAIGKFKPVLEFYDDAVKMWDNRNVLTLSKCRDCDIALLCGGGCAYSAIAVNGDINEPVCNRARETVFAYLGYMKDELAKKITD